jgi:AraC-like DNA-binding protein
MFQCCITLAGVVQRNQLEILFRRQAYLPVSPDSEGVYRIALVRWADGSLNWQSTNGFTVIRLILDGCLRVETNMSVIRGSSDSSVGTSRLASGGWLVAHPMGLPYRQMVSANAAEGSACPCELLMLTVPGQSFARRWRRQLGDGPAVFPLSNAAEMEHLLRLILARAEAPDSLAAATTCRSLLAHVIDCSRRGQPTARSLQQRRGYDDGARSLLMDLGEDLRASYSLQDFAVRHGIDRSTLHRWCLEVFGCSPRAYRQRRRLELAAQELAETTDTIQVIAERVGFSCPFAFSKAFKRHFGISPSQSRSE